MKLLPPTLDELQEGGAFSDTWLFRKIIEHDIKFTGHSLGGALAQHVSSLWIDDDRDRVRAVTFNAPGISVHSLKINPTSYNVINISNHRDLIGNFGIHIGTKVSHANLGDTDYSAIDLATLQRLVELNTAKFFGDITASEHAIQYNIAVMGIADALRRKATVDAALGYRVYGNGDAHTLESLIIDDEAGARLTVSLSSDVAKISNKFMRYSTYYMVVDRAHRGGYLTAALSTDNNAILIDELTGEIAAGAEERYLYMQTKNAFAELAKYRRELGFAHLFQSSQTKYAATVNAAQRRIDPLVLDLNGDGKIDTVRSSESTAYFDLDSNGFAEKTGWVGKNEALLVLDRNEDEMINNGKELFGDQTLLKDGKTYASSGFEALAEFDDNLDGVIDSNDQIFTKLRVWRDNNSDGATDAGELGGLTELGIVSIGLNYVQTGFVDSSNNIQVRAGDFELSNGSRFKIGEYLFQRDASVSHEVGDGALYENVLQLPNLQGAGNISSLHNAMMRDAELKALVEQFVLNEDGDLITAFDEILYKWASVSEIEASSRGGLVDARNLAVLEKMFALNYSDAAGVNPEDSHIALAIQRVYSELRNSLLTKILSQTHLRSLVSELSVDFNQETKEFTINVENFIAKIVEKVELADGSMVNYLKSVSVVLGSYGVLLDAVFNDLRKYLAKKSIDYAKAFTFAGGGAYGDQYRNYLSGYSDQYNLIFGGGGDDELSSNSAFGGHLFGETGMDSLRGSTGDDILDGGLDRDTLYASDGNDTYVFKRGYGHDFIHGHATLSNKNGQDKVVFGEGIEPEDIIFEKYGNMLIMKIQGTDDRLSIQQWKNNDSFMMGMFETGRYYTSSARVAQMIDAMNDFQQEYGLASWSNALTEKPDEAQALINSFWVSKD